MKLDASCMRYLTKDDYRVLVAVEMGMRNHEVVPIPLITSIAKLRHSGIMKILSVLLRHKLLAHTNTQYDGYRLSYLGLDILALHSLHSRGIIDSVGSQIGIGKESDVFEAYSSLTDSVVVVKLHRLGRTSFRAVRNTRDYAEGKAKCSWLYLSRLAAMKEYAYMKALYENQFPTPIPIDQNRHVIVMSKVNGYPLSQLRAGKLNNVASVFDKCVSILRRMAEHGVIHCDLNEFNILINQETEEVTVIDFPQLVSVNHPNAEELFTRDMLGLIKYFSMKMKYQPPEEKLVTFDEIQEIIRQRMSGSGDAAAVSSGLLEPEVVLSADDELLLQSQLGHSSDEVSPHELEAEDKAVNSFRESSSTSVFQFAAATDNCSSPSDTPLQQAIPDDSAGAIEGGDAACEGIAQAGESDSETDSEEKAAVVQQDIHSRVKREQSKKRNKSKGQSRNHTKQINKYGKVDRSLRNFS